jgi:putative FmdB family regulatory protein
MPIYEYQCRSCGRRSSALLPRFDAPDPSCPHCGRPELGRLVSSFATLGGGEDDSDLDDGFDEGEDRAEQDLGDDDW